MAKTTSQIVSENKKLRDSLNAIHEKQMEGVKEKSAERTKAVLAKALSGNSGDNQKANIRRSISYVDRKNTVSSGSSSAKKASKTAVDIPVGKRTGPGQITEAAQLRRGIDAAKKNVEQKKKELEEYQNTEYDWTDAAARELYEKGQKQKEAEISKAQAEQNAAVANFDRVQMNAMSEEDRGLIDEYIRREDTASDPIDTGTAAIVEHFVNQNAGIDEKRLKQLVETRRRELNAQRMQETQEKAQEAVNSGVGSAVLHNALTVPANLIAGAMGTMSDIHDYFNRDERYSGLDPNSMGNQLNVYSGAVRGQTQQNIVGTEEERAAQIAGLVESGYSQSEAEFIVNKGRQGLAALYQAGMSAADTGARAAVGGALGLGAGFGATVAGLNTFSQTMSDASARGATPEQALALAVTTAGIEAATEKVPLDNLIKVSKGGGAKSLIKNILRQAGIEATEEELSLIGTTLADAAIMQEKSEYNLSVAAYMASGMTEEQAREQASWDLIAEAGETAIVSGIAGGIGGFGASTAAAFNQDGLDTAQQGAQQAQVAQNQQDVDVDGQQETAVQEAQAKPQTPQEQERAALEATGEELAKNAPKPEPAEPMTEGQRNLENAAAIVNGVQPEQKAAPAGDESGKTLNEKLYERDWYGVGKRNVKAYMYENPEVKPYFQAEAQNMLMELNDSTRGERFYNDDVYYDSGGEKGITGVKRHTSDDIAYLLDSCGFTYDQIENGLKAIIEDNGAENNAASKRLEFILHDRLMNGYNDFYSNGRVPQSEDYVGLVTQKGVTEYDSTPPVDAQNVSTQGGKDETVSENAVPAPENGREVPKAEQGQEIPEGMKGTGAAERNFSGKAAYQDLLTDENTQRDRPGDVRPMEVPKVDSNGRKVSEFVGNAYGAAVTPDAMASAIESLVQDGKLGFESRSNKQSLENARQSILATSEKETMLTIHDHAEKGAVYDGDVEKALVLYASYANNPEAQDDASSVFMDMVKLSHMSGRNLQLFSLMRRMTPEGQLMTVQKNINRYIDEINKGRPAGKKADASGTNNQAAQAAAAVEKARENTEAAIGKASKLVKYRKGKVEIEGNQAGEPFVFEYAQKVGEGLAKSLEQSLRPKKEKTFMQLITAELRKFASEKMPQQERKKALTATELLRDYIQNQDFYTRAWEEAQQAIRDGGEVDPALQEFVNSGIGVDANNSAKNKIFAKALASAAMESGETAQMLKRQEALGFSNMSETIADRLIAQTGATGEIADTIRDAAKSYVNEQLSAESKKPEKQEKSGEEIVQSSIRSAMQDIKVTLSKVAISDADAKKTVKERITDLLIKKYGFGEADAGGVADVVAQQYEAMVKAQAEKMLKQKFAKREAKDPKSTEQILRELANLGAFRADSEYNRQATAKVLGEKFNATISEELANNFLKAKTDEEKQAALDAIYKDVASNIKPTLGEMWDAWRNLAMLGNTKTHERNFGSTGAWQPFVEVKRNIGAAIESVYLRNRRGERTKSFLGIGKGDRDLIAWARQDAKSKDVQRLMEYSGSTRNEAANAIQDYRKILPGVLDTARKKNMGLMEGADMLFKRNEYSRSLASFLKARGYTAGRLNAETVPANVLNEGRQYAIKEAMKATFNDRNQFSDWFSNFMRPSADSPAIVNIIKKGTIPFLRTPANIIHRAYEYSPASLGKTLITAKSDIDSGRLSASDVIDRVSSGLTGSVAMGLGAALAAGIVPGVRLIAEPDEDEILAGAQKYSIKIGGKYYAAGFLAPAMIPLFIGARLYEDISRKSQDEDGLSAWDVVESLVDTCAHSLDPLLELSMLSSFKNIAESVKSAEKMSEKAVAFCVNAVFEYFSQGIPTVFGQIEQATESGKKSVYVNTGNNIEKIVKKSIGNATKKIPGIDLYQTQKLDTFGAPVEAGDDYIKRTFDALFNPSSVTEETKDPVIQEIVRLNGVQEMDVSPRSVDRAVSYTDKNGRYHENVRLSEDQYQTFATVQGQNAKRIADGLVQSGGYNALTDKQKAAALNLAYDYAADKARRAALDGYPDASGWMAGIDGKEAVEIIKKVNADTLQSAMNDLTAAWANGWDDSGKKNALSESYDTLNKMGKSTRDSVIAESSGWTSAFLEVRDQGVSAKKYYSAAENIAKVKGTGAVNKDTGKATVRDIDVRQAIANTTGMTDREIDIVMRAYMDDYDPTAKSPETTEFKYQYVREELGLSPDEYASTYRAYLDSSKKAGKIEAIRALGYDYRTAKKLYDVYYGNMKKQLIEMYG